MMAKTYENQDTEQMTKGYAELNAEAYAIAIDAFASANRRALDFFKSMFEIVSRPYTSTAVESTVRENLDRANQVVSLTVSEMQAAAAHNGELLEKTAKFAAKWQETAVASGQGVVKTMVSNLNYVRETADAQAEEFAKRVEKLQTISKN
jgi:hypothetical protein